MLKQTLKNTVGFLIPLPLLSSLYFELKILGMRLTNAINPLHWSRVSQLKERKDAKVHFACGTVYLDGWVNIDGISSHKHDITMDLRRSIPLLDNQAQVVFCEHFVEHLAFDKEVLSFFGECHRILQPGGRLRITVPDAGLYLKKYVENDIAFFQRERPDCPTPMEAVNHVFRQAGQHKWAYDFNELSRMLKKAGFQSIEQMSFGQSHIADFSYDSPHRQGESLYVEAVR